MLEDVFYYKELLAKWLAYDCTPEEVEKVLLFLKGDVSNKVLLRELRAEFDRAMELREGIPVEVSERLRKRLMEEIGARPVRWRGGRPVREIWVGAMRWRVAAAVILVVAGAGVFWGVMHHRGPLKDIAVKKNGMSQPASVRPQATITLDSGSRIVLDDSAGSRGGTDGRDGRDGTLARQGNVRVVKMADGGIAYELSAVAGGKISYHTLTVPEGCKPVQLLLSDGTKVWVNTASVLRYPTAFNGGKRDVTLMGEAYFDVAQMKEKPFSVQTQYMTVQVLGTAFDVSSYNDDGQRSVVLESGRVALTAGGHSGGLQRRLAQLAPGELARYSISSGQLSVAAVHTEEYISWRKGYLIFKRASLEEIIKRLSRYYRIEVDVRAADLKKETFSGRLDFQQNIEDIMEMVCQGTPFVYLSKERKLVINK